MTIVSRLATSLHRKDEEPNVLLAQLIVEEGDKADVQELIDNLRHKDKGIQSDCIKVLYEIGMLKPTFLVEHVQTFVDLLTNKNNRLVWGAMTALDAIASADPQAVYEALPSIMNTANTGSVITRDHGVSILIKLYSVERYTDQIFPHLIKQLESCPTNQLPMYAENAMPVIHDRDRALFVETLLSRLIEIEKDSKRKRVEKVIKKLS
ncbi:sister chromatid cohesion protein PDS5 [Cohnella abietis]|uniref:Clathrin/coatomer adaptor adaptin-like N-terminal domain-containing protein n=1 Tax=Cohnella abietis TaxID=2507935 RepID=A0A3T1D2U3_9BACL|nr:sister chromatid cohesion protein PDS5 [Cohnella abietis]BBI32420.1 hypothetical protein KCTCHS21_18190 [Cohnella abietis]